VVIGELDAAALADKDMADKGLGEKSGNLEMC
jgi:hypothetical protein